MEAFVVQEIDDHNQDFSVVPLTNADDAGGFDEFSCGASFAPAVLQRRLQAIGDLAERELKAIQQPVARVLRGSPEADIELMRRRLQLPNKQRLPAPLRRQINLREDPLVAVASHLRCGGQEAQKVVWHYQPRYRQHVADARLRKQQHLKPLWESATTFEDTRKQERERVCESRISQIPSVESRALGKSVGDDAAELSLSSACDSAAATYEQRGFSPRRLMPRTPTPQSQRATPQSQRATPTARATTPLIQGKISPAPPLKESAQSMSMVATPILQSTRRSSTASSTPIVQPLSASVQDVPSPLASRVDEGRSASRACLGSSMDISQMKAAPDPVAFLVMYKEMLLEETNNGLMGGTPFLSDAGCRPEDLRSCIAQHLRQGGPWKGLSRSTLSPLLSRS